MRIKIKTPVGTSESEETGPTVTQGGVDAALVSANNVDVGVCETFTDELKEIEYENVRLNGLRYMDDILRMAREVKNAQEANDAMEEMMGRKNLQFNLD